MYLKAIFFCVREEFWQGVITDHQPSNITFIFLSIFFRLLSFMIFLVKGRMYELKVGFAKKCFFDILRSYP